MDSKYFVRNTRTLVKYVFASEKEPMTGSMGAGQVGRTEAAEGATGLQEIRHDERTGCEPS